MRVAYQSVCLPVHVYAQHSIMYCTLHANEWIHSGWDDELNVYTCRRAAMKMTHHRSQWEKSLSNYYEHLVLRLITFVITHSVLIIIMRPVLEMADAEESLVLAAVCFFVPVMRSQTSFQLPSWMNWQFLPAMWREARSNGRDKPLLLLLG